MSLLQKEAPVFSLPDSEGSLVSLSDYRGSRVLLVFYPGDDTPVCTKQLCSYSSGFEEFQGLGVKLLGINMDSVESHKKFKAKYKLPFPLLSDEKGDVCKAYDAKGLLGIKRATYLIDENGKIIFENVVLPMFFKDKEDIIGEIKKIL